MDRRAFLGTGLAAMAADPLNGIRSPQSIKNQPKPLPAEWTWIRGSGLGWFLMD